MRMGRKHGLNDTTKLGVSQTRSEKKKIGVRFVIASQKNDFSHEI